MFTQLCEHSKKSTELYTFYKGEYYGMWIISQFLRIGITLNLNLIESLDFNNSLQENWGTEEEIE